MNNTKRLVAFSSGILGATGIGLLSAGQAQAATTATVNYTDGATTVWTSPTTGQTAKRYIFKGQSVNLLASQKIGAETWYRIGNGEWVPERYLTTTDKPAVAETETAQQTVRVAYADGATTVWSTPTYTAPTGRYLTYGQTEGVTKTQTVNGETWYQLANGGWMPARFTGEGQLKATPTVQQTPVATTPAPAATQPAVAESTAPVVSEPAAPVTSESTSSAVETSESVAPVESTPVQESTTPAVETSSESAATSSTPVVEAPQQESVASSTSTTQTTNNTQETTNTNTNNNQQTTTPSTPAPATPAPSTPAPTAPATTGNAQSVINLAMAQIGKPYVWGAKGPSSFDCSGLMNYVFKQAAGRDIGGWTVPQESAGYSVSLSSLQPGDLLFWGAQGGSYHVALYIGGGQYIHAPQPGENVKIGSMQYYAPDFAKRVF